MSRVTGGEGVNWPQSSINWVLLGIHQQWIDKSPPEELDAELLAIPDDPAAEEDGDDPPLV
jgi:hypothetical protein